MKFSPEYYTVNVPTVSGYDGDRRRSKEEYAHLKRERSEIINFLKQEDIYKVTQSKMSEEQAKALALEIENKYNIKMNVNKTMDLYL